MLYLINIHWTRRQPEADRPQRGFSTYAELGRYLSTAKAKAVKRFNRHYGEHLEIEKVTEKNDPAGIFQ